jgi:ribosomal protein S18 acetylase RimI-like enzyme
MDQEQPVRIIPFKSRYAQDFKRLNFEWLQKYFRVEPIDEVVLSEPRKIIDAGGSIFLAQRGREIIGTCALLAAADGRYELTKMSVTQGYQGLGIGRRLLQAALEVFKLSGARELFLDTNSILNSAIALYESVGFVHAKRRSVSAYERSNVYMVYRKQH